MPLESFLCLLPWQSFRMEVHDADRSAIAKAMASPVRNILMRSVRSCLMQKRNNNLLRLTERKVKADEARFNC